MSDNRKKVGEEIRARRKARGWATRELAKRTSLGESTIRQIEHATGKSLPRPTTLEILSKTFNLPSNYLVNVLNGVGQEEIPIMQVVDNVALLSSIVEVRQRLDRLDAEMRQRLDTIDAGMRERQALAEVVYLERHRVLERELGNLGAMLKRLSPPDIIYHQDSDTGDHA